MKCCKTGNSQFIILQLLLPNETNYATIKQFHTCMRQTSKLLKLIYISVKHKCKALNHI